MKILQRAYVAILVAATIGVLATSETLHGASGLQARTILPAPAQD